MKKLLVILLTLALLGSTALADFTNLRDAQDYLYKHAPSEMAGQSIRLSIKGKIVGFECLKSNHWEMFLEVDEEHALTPTGSDLPRVIGHFRLHLDSVDDLPFAVGDEALIVGTLNEFYCTPMVPYLMIESVNGYSSDEF